jgi:hypothetical protein
MAQYTLALLQLLNEEGRLTTRLAIEAFEKKYRDRIPEDMYGMVGNEVKWANRVRWERLNLARLGLMGNDQRGIWYITEKGYQFLREHPDDALRQLQDLLATDANRAKEERQKKPRTPNIKISMPKKIIENRQATLSSQEFEDIDSLAHRKLRQEIQTIRDYLHGVSALQPSNELLCDWVHFCYNFELYAEGLELYTLVASDDVNPWYYERTRKMARLCAMKVKEQQG